MTAFIDSHAHLADPAFDLDRPATIERARTTGAKALVCIGESIGAARRSSRPACIRTTARRSTR
jgi:Tat protein secretion system quality control protein TatD with DNase activity